MIIFNQTFILSTHVVDRYKERTKQELSEEEVNEDILKMVNEGIEIFEQEDHKFIRYQDYIFPCVRLKNTKSAYKVKTLLTWEISQKLIYYIEHFK